MPNIIENMYVKTCSNQPGIWSIFDHNYELTTEASVIGCLFTLSELKLVQQTKKDSGNKTGFWMKTIFPDPLAWGALDLPVRILIFHSAILSKMWLVNYFTPMDGLSLLYTIRMDGLGNEEHGWTISGADTGFRPGGGVFWNKTFSGIRNRSKEKGSKIKKKV